MLEINRKYKYEVRIKINLLHEATMSVPSVQNFSWIFYSINRINELKKYPVLFECVKAISFFGLVVIGRVLFECYENPYRVTRLPPVYRSILLLEYFPNAAIREKAARCNLQGILSEWAESSVGGYGVREGQQRILKCFNQKEKTLNLSDLQLTSLPHSCFRYLTHCKELELSKNNLKSLPSTIGLLTELKSLSVYGNQLISVPSEIENLKNLKSLFLNRNRIKNIPSEIGSLTELETLSLARNELETLPAEIGKLTKLKGLDLNDNCIQVLNKEIENLKDLQVLHIQKNKIKCLPAEISSLTNLIELVAGENELYEICPEIGRLQKLNRLKLDNNVLTELPDTFSELRNLETLTLTHNILHVFPHQICFLTQLNRLSIGGNRLEEIPDSIGQLVNLKQLGIANNNLQFLPGALGELQKLSRLEVSSNSELSELPMAIGDCAGLIYIDTLDTKIPDELRDGILQQCRAERDKELAENLPLQLHTWKGFSLVETDLTKIADYALQEKMQISEWLRRLQGTKEFARAQTKLAQAVCRMLAFTLSNPDFKAMFFAQISSNLSSCEDRAGMAFDEIYLSWRLLSMEEKTPLKEKVELLVRAAKTQALRHALSIKIEDHQKASGMIERESVQIFLYYEIELRQKLDLLKAIDHMKYGEIGQREWIKVDDLVKEVNLTYLQNLVDLPAFSSTLAKEEVYQEYFVFLEQEMMRLTNDKRGGESEQSLDYLEWFMEFNDLKKRHERAEVDAASLVLAQLGL